MAALPVAVQVNHENLWGFYSMKKIGGFYGILTQKSRFFSAGYPSQF